MPQILNTKSSHTRAFQGSQPLSTKMLITVYITDRFQPMRKTLRSSEPTAYTSAIAHAFGNTTAATHFHAVAFTLTPFHDYSIKKVARGKLNIELHPTVREYLRAKHGNTLADKDLWLAYHGK